MHYDEPTEDSSGLYEACLEAYREIYETDPPVECWPDPTDSDGEQAESDPTGNDDNESEDDTTPHKPAYRYSGFAGCC